MWRRYLSMAARGILRQYRLINIASLAVGLTRAIFDGKTYIDMEVRCEADKTACDQLVIQFQQLNGRTAASAQKSN